ncbi:MAG: ABC transporter permease [Acidimicrobiales bacterium]
MTADDGMATIHDRGYRRFEGTRLGVWGAVRSTAWHTTRSVLGLGRKARHKVAPTLVIIVAMLPAVVFVGAAVLLGGDEFINDFLVGIIPAYSELARQSIAAMVLFTGFVAPEALVRDRRDGMLSLYLSTPLTRRTYLGAKVLSVSGLMALIVLVPTLVYLLGMTFASLGPEGVGDWLLVLVRVVVSGTLASIIYALISMAAASLTDRRAFASLAVVLTMLGTLIVVQILVDSADRSVQWRMLDPVNMPMELIARIFGDAGEYPAIRAERIYAANAAWAGGSIALLWARYRKAGA